MKDSIRPLIIGADGLVGGALAARFEEVYPHATSAGRVELDITDRWRVEAEIERLEPSVVVNCAAMSDVDACERDPEQAFLVNGEGPANLARACRNAGIRFVHFSTDYVFDGTCAGEYDEADAPAPINVYGLSKLHGEMAALEALPDVVVLRVSFVFGAGRRTFLDKIVDQARQPGTRIPVLDGWTTKPTATGEIVRVVEQVLASDATGLWHLAGPPAVSRLEFARDVLRLLGADPERVVPIDPSNLKLPARRPDRSPLGTARLEARFGPLRPWTDWAREYLGLPDGPRG